MGPTSRAAEEVVVIIDGDQHFSEPLGMWQDYADPAKRELALTISPDELGYWWIWSEATGRRIWYAYVGEPGTDDFTSIGKPLERRRQGLPSLVDYSRDVPKEFCDPAARLAKLDEWGIDKTVLIPNFGLLWARGVWDRLDIIQANLESWNRYAVEVLIPEGKGRLAPLGHVTMRGGSTEWLDSQLRQLSAGGVRLAMVNYDLIDGRRLSHRSHDQFWRLFVEHGITPVWHVNQGDQRASALSEAWFEGDDPNLGVFDFTFASWGFQIGLADMVLGGVFERVPALNLCLMECWGPWLPELLFKLDVSYTEQIHTNGKPLHLLAKKPSDTLLDHIKTSVHWKLERQNVHELINAYGDDKFFYGGDFPHPEGLADPLRNFQASVGAFEDAKSEEKFYGGVLGELLHV